MRIHFVVYVLSCEILLKRGGDGNNLLLEQKKEKERKKSLKLLLNLLNNLLSNFFTPNYDNNDQKTIV